MNAFFHSLHRDWSSWTIVERIVALGLFAGVPLTILALSALQG